MKALFIFSLIALLLVISCTTEPKTQPIILDEEDLMEEKENISDIVDVTGAVTKEIVNITETNETNETEEMTKTIIIEDLKFKPEEITIPQGTTVMWKHNDKYLDQQNLVHMIMVYPLGKRSERMFYGDIFNITFEEPGKYYYIDIIYKEEMKGFITVE